MIEPIILLPYCVGIRNTRKTIKTLTLLFYRIVIGIRNTLETNYFFYHIA